MATDYQFNLDKVDRILKALDGLPSKITYKPLLAFFPLDKRDQVFFRRGMWKQLPKLTRSLEKLRRKQKIFMRISTISAKDVQIDWNTTDVIAILQQFITSQRIMEDMDEALARNQDIGLCVAALKSFGTEYRTFVTPNSVVTRNDKGQNIVDSAFPQMAALLRPHFQGSFVFDVGELNGNYEIIEMNQFDDTTDLYM